MTIDIIHHFTRYNFIGDVIVSYWNHVEGKITLRVRSRGTGDDSPIYRIIEAAPEITGEEGSAVFTTKPRDPFPVSDNGDEYYHEAEIIIYGDLTGNDPDETYDKIVDFVNYLIDNCDVYGEITLEEDRTIKIADGFFVRTSKTFEILSRR